MSGSKTRHFTNMKGIGRNSLGERTIEVELTDPLTTYWKSANGLLQKTTTASHTLTSAQAESLARTDDFHPADLSILLFIAKRLER